MPVALERLTLAHEAQRLAAVQQGLPELLPAFHWCVQPYTAAANRQRIVATRGHWQQMFELNFAVLDADSDEFLGEASIDEIDATASSANLSYWIRRDARGRGCGSAAATVLAAFAFRELGLQRLFILAAADNPASLRVAQKLGASLVAASPPAPPAEATLCFVLDHRHRPRLLQQGQGAYLQRSFTGEN